MKKLLVIGSLSACVSSREALETLVIDKYGTKEHGWHRATGVELDNPVPADARSIDNGKALYSRYCSVCHGAEAQPSDVQNAKRSTTEPQPADLRSIAGSRSDYHFYLQISLGRQGMPIWSEELSERDRWDIVNYIKSLKSR